MHRYPSNFLPNEKTTLKVANRGSFHKYPTSTSIDPAALRHLIINGGWRIWSKESLDEALSVLPVLPALEVLRLHYMTWDNVSVSSKTILTSSFTNVIQLELSRFGCDTLQELVGILLCFPRLESLSFYGLDEPVESVRTPPELGSVPPFQHLKSLHIADSYAADFLLWFLKIEPLPPICRLSLGAIADNYCVDGAGEPWQDRGILAYQEKALKDCHRHFATQLEHVIYRTENPYAQALDLPALRIMEGRIWAISSMLRSSTFGALSTIVLHVDHMPSLVDEKHTQPLRHFLRYSLITPPLASVRVLHIILQEWMLFYNNGEEDMRKAEADIRRELGPEFEARGGTVSLSWSSVGKSWGGGLDS
ncbi:hypothetical protein MVEN_00650800 [Mycena venus]|uniref:Uncharacterized protein n=1 Tax=Mycena venus TaxID=2733690 RepID=A0A8H6YQH3_9AGAR|nr:hypothetical protein MVEN_00650800 [Mycena venus]